MVFLTEGKTEWFYPRSAVKKTVCHTLSTSSRQWMGKGDEIIQFLRLSREFVKCVFLALIGYFIKADSLLCV